MKEIIIGSNAKTGAAETLHIEEDGCLCMVEGDWLYREFRRRAKQMARKNGFDDDDRLQMEAAALAELLKVRSRYDATKAGDSDGYKRYLRKIIKNLLQNEAAKVADERRIWQSFQSLDAPLDEDEDTTLGDMVADGETANENGLRLDVVLVTGDLDARSREWCRKVLTDCTTTQAYEELQYSKSNFYAFVIPRLRKAFADVIGDR